ncbi:MAG: hypothetical protein WDO74_13905 [Pseudomonadota bacterium]
MLPSEPTAKPVGPAPLAVLNSVSTPLVVMRPTLLRAYSVNHRFPSGPVTICVYRSPGDDTVNSPDDTSGGDAPRFDQ